MLSVEGATVINAEGAIILKAGVCCNILQGVTSGSRGSAWDVA